MCVVSLRVTSLRENCILYEPRDAVLVSHGPGEFDVLLGHGVNRHSGHGARVGHFRQTHDDGRRRSFLREQIVIDANDRAIPNDPPIGKCRTRLEKVRAGESFFCRRSALNVASRFDVAARCVERAAGHYRQLKTVNEQFGLKLFRQPCARIDYNFARDRIGSILLEFSDPCRDRRQFLRGNACQFPCHLRRVDLEKCKAQLLARTRKHLRRWKDKARLFWAERCAPARFSGQSVAAIAFEFRRNGNLIALREIEVAGDFDRAAAGEKFHFLHCRLDADSLRRCFHRVDVVVKLDANRRLLESMIERADPFHFERFGFSRRDHLQIGKRTPAFRVEQPIHDQIKRASDGKWLSRPNSKRCCFQWARAFLLDGLNYLDRTTVVRIAVLKVNVLGRFDESNRIS